TFASKSLSRSLSRTGLFFKQRIWIWPIIATVVLSVVGYGVRSAIESTMKENLKSQLQTLLNVEVGMLQSWWHVQTSNVSALANNQAIRESIYKLLEAHDAGNSTASPSVSPSAVPDLNRQLSKQLSPAISAHEYAGFFIANKSRQIVSATSQQLIGMHDIPEYDGFISKALKGEANVCAPFPSVIAMPDESGRLRTGTPTMYVCAPVRDASFEVVGVLALRIRPEQELTQIMQLGRIGESGETYGFDKSGLLISNSRFDEQLILTGLLPDQPNARSILNVQIRDPQGDLTQGFHPTLRRSALPLTKMAQDAVSGNSGVDVEGYRDYRGVPVIGAWTWLPQFEMGVTTEIDVAEAYEPLFILQWTFWALFVLLAISSAAIFIFTVMLSKLRREAQRASINARQLGQYTLENKLGAGAMGVVYKGHHAMLRRPTAIKLLDVDKVNDASIQRFEREVQITCQLNHPNTVAIYDYGRTPEGVFYYAMEYLDGINLESLVERYGPQPEGRVVRILLQLCGSLFEAHSQGLVHRDIKPANLMLNRRGCEADILKVLDFGLVKAADEKKQASLTTAGAITGTPLYMAPEAIQAPNSVDGRSDLYAVGAVGYFLLTGETVFTAKGIVELCTQHIDETPIPPSQRLGKPVSVELENALLGCLEKMRTKRPATARDLAQMLLRCPTAQQWTMEDADAWWGRHERGHGTESTSGTQSGVTGKTLAPSALDRTMVSNHAD
ncbi:MAG: serine/threonine kinase, partial [Planctomycetaceae bacterium]|nr:serine/threonine kinase [Planctomycetaceae bacterium]